MWRQQLRKLDDFLADPYLAEVADALMAFVLPKLQADPAVHLESLVDQFRQQNGVLTHEEHHELLEDVRALAPRIKTDEQRAEHQRALEATRHARRVPA